MLSINFQGAVFEEKFRKAIEEIKNFQSDIKNWKEKAENYKNDYENNKRAFESLIKEFENYKMINQNSMNESMTINNDSEKLSSQCSSSQPNNESLQQAQNIIVSTIRHGENSRESDICLGTSTNQGYITSSSCCPADEMVLFDLENSKTIPLETKSFWIGEEICFINTTDSFAFNVSISTQTKQNCTIQIFDSDTGKFDKQELEFEIKNCFESPCILNSYSIKNETILNGTSIVCERSTQSTHLGVVTKSELKVLMTEQKSHFRFPLFTPT